MTDTDPQLEEKLRQGFKYLNCFMLIMWRLGLGNWLNAWPQVLGRYMVVTHTGRKSGRPRRTPVNYASVANEIYCTAGFGPASDWYRNIKANPQVEVWLPEGWWNGVAEEVVDPSVRFSLLRQVLIGSGFAARAFGLDPVTMLDDELASKTSKYPLIHIKRLAARTGPGGPGDLAWVWPIATTFLLLKSVFRRK